MLAGNKVIITCALNGGMQQDRMGAIIPKQPDEIGEAAARCYEAGAAMIHVHARDPGRQELGRSRDLLRDHPPDPQAIADPDPDHQRHRRASGSGHGTVPLAVRCRTPRPADAGPSQDLYGIAAGSADFHNPEGGYPEETPYVNSPALLKKTIKAVYEKGSALEYEVVEASSLHRLLRYSQEGLFDRDRDNVWLLHGGGFGATPAIARNVLFAIDEGPAPLPEGDLGRHRHGARHVPDRDARTVPRLRPASVSASRTASTCRMAASPATTATWCARAAQIAAIYGLKPATVDEARARFRI